MHQQLSTPSSKIILNAPAKINWSLYILNKREDGFHNIVSLLQCIDLYDTISFEESGSIELITDMDLPVEQNIIFRTAILLQKHSGMNRGVRITLEKRIPSGAGLGGGSSDAACTIIGLNKLWGLSMGIDEMKSIGAKLGSDVPFFFHCPIAIARGRGDILTPLSISEPFALLIVKPHLSISTAWAYEELYNRRKLTKMNESINNIQLIFNSLKERNFSILSSFVQNDFEDVVIRQHPVIGTIKRRLLDAGAFLALMSGSGSTVFGLFENKDRAVEATRYFEHYWNKVVETIVN